MNQGAEPPMKGRLQVFVGRWRNTGHLRPGPMGPGGPISGTTAYGWEMNGKWLLYTSRLDLPGMGPYEVRGGVTVRGTGDRYDAYAVNSLGDLMVYDGQWSDETALIFTLVHPASGKARVVYRVQPGGWIQMRSEQKDEKGHFVPYFETTMAPA